MSHQVTVKFELDVKDGPKLKKDQPLSVDAYMPLNAEIKNDKQWHTLRLDAGSKQFVKFLVIDSDIYAPDAACAANGHALYLQFIDDEKDPIDAMKMDGPHIYMGPSLDLLPEQISQLRFKNSLPRTAQVKIILGKEAYVPDKDNVEAAQAEKM